MNWRNVIPGERKLPERRVVTVNFWQAPWFAALTALIGLAVGIQVGQSLSGGSVREGAQSTEHLKNELERSEASASLLAEELSEMQLQKGGYCWSNRGTSGFFEQPAARNCGDAGRDRALS